MIITFPTIWLLLANLSLGVTQVDLGYAIYNGVADSTTGLTTFKGIRYASPPTGSLRWQAPEEPAVDRSSVKNADSFGPTCPQTPFSLNPVGVNPGTIGDEDCLVLNVYAPSTASGLPVMVYIHGGGYGSGNGQQDLTSIITANQNSFIGITIQYRLGAFGFLSSAEVLSNGVLNAGILDQNLALKWVQKYIFLFGGDPSRVTIAGESAGAGSVMYHNLANGGAIGNSLFVNSISASPYLPKQYKYSDPVPTGYYQAFVAAAGCTTNSPFACLVAKNTTILQEASFNVSGSAEYGAWAFVPVTDGSYIQPQPSQQLLQKKLNGQRHLTGNNELEGNIFVLQSIATQSDLDAWITSTYPSLTSSDKSKLATYYPVAATTPQDVANKIYGDATFGCPSYWLAEAYSGKGSLVSYKYQYSVPMAFHTTDMGAYFGPPAVNQGPDFVKAFQSVWGNFITKNDPSISNSIANGASSSSPNAANPASNWPAYSRASPNMINLNETGGTLVEVTLPFGPGYTFMEPGEPGLTNDITLVNTTTWEDGKGARCDFWRSISADVPE